MDQDVVVQYLMRGLALLGAAVALFMFSTWLAGRICRRAGLSSGWILLAQILAPVSLFYAASLYLDVTGQVVQARVVSTEEKISSRSSGRSLPGSWARSFWANVTFDAPEGPRGAVLWLDEPTYDALDAGSPIAVRYLPWLPMIARPADKSTRSLVPWRWAAAGILLLIAGLALRPILRPVSAGLKAFVGLAAIATAVVVWVFPTPWETPLEPPILTANAHVRHVREVTRSLTSGRTTGSVDAPQPWNVVELQFVPDGRKKPVIAVDSVDVGSVAGLVVGAQLPVTYNASHPRDARLAGARTWRRKEWGELAELGGTIVLGLVAIVLLSKAAGGWWRRQVRGT